MQKQSHVLLLWQVNQLRLSLLCFKALCLGLDLNCKAHHACSLWAAWHGGVADLMQLLQRKADSGKPTLSADVIRCNTLKIATMRVSPIHALLTE